MLYGAYGFTGRLLLAEAVRRGHRPVLAGRNAAKLAALATQYDLDWLALDLDYAERLNKTIERFTLVFHAAGPFIHTSEPMVRACLAGQTQMCIRDRSLRPCVRLSSLLCALAP